MGAVNLKRAQEAMRSLGTEALIGVILNPRTNHTKVLDNLIGIRERVYAPIPREHTVNRGNNGGSTK